MTIPLPNELVDSILGNLYFDKPTLLNCALVGKAWTPSSQRGIFQRIVLESPSPHHEDYAELCEAYIKSNDGLIRLFNNKPRLASYVRFLELRNFDRPIPHSARLLHNQEAVHDSTAVLVRLFTNLDSLSLFRMNWIALSPFLQSALGGLFRNPETRMTRVTLALFAIPRFEELVGLLGGLRCLRALKVSFLNCTDWEVPGGRDGDDSRSKSESFSGLESEEDGTSMMISTGTTSAPPPPRSIHLDQLLHFHQVHLRSFTTWLQQDSCPFEVRNLRSLQIHRSETPFDFGGTAFMLQYVGDSLRELELLGPYRVQHSNLVHLGYTPNLDRVSLVSVQQTDNYTPVPWIQCLFEPLLNHHEKKKRYPLRRLTIDLNIDHIDDLNTPQWDHWTTIDTLLSQPELSALERVTIILQSGLVELKKLMKEKLSTLEATGRLRVVMPSHEDRYMRGIKTAVTLW